MVTINKSVVINAVDNAFTASKDISDGISNISSFIWEYNQNIFSIPMNIYIPENLRKYNFSNIYAIKSRLDNLKSKLNGLTYDMNSIIDIMFENDEQYEALILRTLNPYDYNSSPSGALMCPVYNDYFINNQISNNSSCPSWLNNRTMSTEGNKNNTEIWVRRGISTGMGFIPFVDDIKDAQEAITGVDLITGERLAWWERALCGTLFLISAGAAIFTFGISEAIPISSLDEVIRGAKYADEAVDVIRNADEVVDGAKYADEVFDFGEGIIKSDSLSGAQKKLADIWTGHSNIDGVDVYKNDELIDIDIMDYNGKTNLERIEDGLSPIGPDGKSVELHHWDQTSDSAIYEIESSFHKEAYSDLHINIGGSDSLIDRNEFGNFRRDYWKSRAADFYKDID